jgi:KDO2-lipid IV(A) lauroyltransferase
MKAPRKTFSLAKRLRFRLETALARTLSWLVPKFSRRTVQRAGRALGWLAFYLSAQSRRVALANLDIAFGGAKSRAEKLRIARASMQSAAATLLCLFWAPRLTRENLAQFAEVDEQSLRRVRQIAARGAGIIFITPHFGDWELLGLATGFYGIQLTVVQEAEQNVALEEIFARLRAVSGHRIVPNRYAAATLLKTLKRGGSIALLIDLNSTPNRGGMWLEFFGLPVFGIAAAGALAMRTGAAIVPGIAQPLPDGRTRIVYGPELDYQLTGNDEADARAINQQCLSFCEQLIRSAPEHWLWSYKRWKFLPAEQRAGYPFYSRHWPGKQTGCGQAAPMPSSD